MQARSFLSEMRESVRHFYATTMRGEVSDANIRGYLRAASQIEEVWQRIDEQLAALSEQGTAPWEAYAKLRYPLAFIRVARTYQVLVKELLAADAAYDPRTAGFLPHVTYDQANAFCHQIQPSLQQAIAALSDATYQPEAMLPFALVPRIESEGAPCPVAHLQGMIGAAREVRDWAAGLLAQYELAIQSASGPAPAEIASHLTALHGRLTQGDSQLRFGVDLVGQISQGEATPELHEEAEKSLWEALQTFFLLNQVVAMPGSLHTKQAQQAVVAPNDATPARRGQRRKVYRDQHIRPDDLWRVAASSARTDLRGTEFGKDEMKEMCEKMGGILSAGAQQYLDEVEAAVARGDAVAISAMANCPFEPLYRARSSLEIAGAHIPTNHEFHWNFHRGHIETSPRFKRTNNWKECEE